MEKYNNADDKNDRFEDSARVAKDELMCKNWHKNRLVSGSAEAIILDGPHNPEILNVYDNNVAFIDNCSNTNLQSEELVESIQNGTEFIFDTSDMDTGEWTLFTGDIGSEFHILDEDQLELTDIICYTPSMETCKVCGLQYMYSDNKIDGGIPKENNVCGLCMDNDGDCTKGDLVAEKSNCQPSSLNRSPTVKYIAKGEGRYYCVVCDKKFALKKSLDDHKKVHLKEKLFQCHICMKQFNRKSTLELHIMGHEKKPVSGMVLVCSFCKMAFKDLKDAQLHVNDLGECIDSTVGDISVNIPIKQKVESEIAIKSEEKIQDIPGEILLKDISDVAKKCVTVIEVDEVYLCDYCEKAYYDKLSLKKHKENHKKLDKPFKCGICEMHFDTYSKRFSHQMSHKMFRQGNKFLECPNLNVYSQNKFTVCSYYVCEECNKTFIRRRNLVTHIKHIHTRSSILFQCETCGKEYSSKPYLNLHIKKKHKINNGANPKSDDRSLQIIPTEPSYHCSECGDTFLHSSSLRNHKRRCQIKEANFTCSVCEKKFVGAHDLKKHLRLHTGERPFNCEVCQKNFRTKSSYNEHVSTHSGLKPHACDICGNTFRRARAMKSHRLNHMKKRQFNCSHCRDVFNFLSDLKQHIQHNHRNNKDLENKKGSKFNKSGEATLKPSVDVENEYLKTTTDNNLIMFNDKQDKISSPRANDIVYKTDQQIMSLLINHL